MYFLTNSVVIAHLFARHLSIIRDDPLPLPQDVCRPNHQNLHPSYLTPQPSQNLSPSANSRPQEHTTLPKSAPQRGQDLVARVILKPQRLQVGCLLGRLAVVGLPKDSNLVLNQVRKLSAGCPVVLCTGLSMDACRSASLPST